MQHLGDTMKFKNALLSMGLILPLGLLAQSDQEIEEVVVVGSQIKGAKITGALPVSIISSDDIDALGVESGDELLDNIAELKYFPNYQNSTIH